MLGVVVEAVLVGNSGRVRELDGLRGGRHPCGGNSGRGKNEMVIPC